ncbi:MAG: hypothetical protein LBT86_05170 [Deltaproteobacteria bacterium]|jgi:hypothetical protein|nr:hypothetical protein [Deltaproteobacteria bacterium]
MVRNLGGQLKEALTGAMKPRTDEVDNARSMVIGLVARKAIGELVNQAKKHPQRGDLASANPAYVSLSELSENHGLPGLALGLRYETGEISFLDMSLDPETANKKGGAFVDRSMNRTLWRQLKKLVAIKVDRTMLGPVKPIRSPEDFLSPGEGEEP